MKLSEIQIRDPFVLPVAQTQTYYLFGTTDKNCWDGPFEGFDCYSSRDLENWDGPFAAFRPAPDFWADADFWAPEVVAHAGKFWMMATFISPNRERGTQILVSDAPQGPFVPWSDGPVTPENWRCLDGTLFFEPDGAPWMIFCHEWQQIGDGTICATRLSPDLKSARGEPVTLFSASQAPWSRSSKNVEIEGQTVPLHVTDGPFFHRTRSGALLMLWSSFGAQGYAMGIARSRSGSVLGPWTQDETPLWAKDGGHGMLFQSFDGQWWLVFHTPNQSPNERAVFFEVEEVGDTLRLKSS